MKKNASFFFYKKSALLWWPFFIFEQDAIGHWVNSCLFLSRLKYNGVKKRNITSFYRRHEDINLSKPVDRRPDVGHKKMHSLMNDLLMPFATLLLPE